MEPIWECPTEMYYSDIYEDLGKLNPMDTIASGPWEPYSLSSTYDPLVSRSLVLEDMWTVKLFYD